MLWQPRVCVSKLAPLFCCAIKVLAGTHVGKNGNIVSNKRTFILVVACILSGLAWTVASMRTVRRSSDELRADALFERALERAGHLESQCESCWNASNAAYASPPLKMRDNSVQPLVWDGSPIVVPELRLIYCSIPKNACTQMKRIVHRVRGSRHWNVTDTALERWHIHKPETNHLIYLRNLSMARANDVMHDPRWTRLILVRDPIERFASAFLDKCARAYYEAVRNGGDKVERKRVVNINCPVSTVDQSQSAEEVLRAVERRAFWHGVLTLNSHFRPQSSFCDMDKYSGAYLAVDMDRASTDVPQCVIKNLQVGPAARGAGLAASQEVLGNEDLVTHRTASRELARNWTAEADACLTHAAMARRASPQRACRHVTGMRLRRLYRSDYQLAWNMVPCANLV